MQTPLKRHIHPSISSLPPLDQTTNLPITDPSLFLELPFTFPHSLILSTPSISLTEFESLMNGFALIFVSLGIYIDISYYKTFLEAKKI